MPHKSNTLVSLSWIPVLLLCVAFQAWSILAQIKRVEYVTSIAQQSAAPSDTSATGYAGNTRELIVPEHLDDCYAWIAHTQQMFAKDQWRIREIDYENAPFGRPVQLASPYRWWLGLVAYMDHRVSGRPIGLAVERAAAVADPLLQAFWLIATAIFVARYFGCWPASAAAIGLTTFFPLGAAFLPAVPEDFSFTIILAFWSVLLLVVGIRTLCSVSEPGANDPQTYRRRAQCGFFASGILGGFGLWINVAVAVPLQCGAALGALWAGWIFRNAGRSNLSPIPWRAWATGGALAVLASYLGEYGFSHLGGWELRVVHPLYGLAWLGGGEVLSVVSARIQGSDTTGWGRKSLRLLAGIVAAAALPFTMWKADNAGFLAINLLSFHLTKQMDGVLAPNFAQWLSRDGVSATLCATVAPLILVAIAVWWTLQKKIGERDRASLAVVLGPVLVVLLFAWYRLRWWQVLDGLLLILAIVGTALVCMRGSTLWRRSAWLMTLGAVCVLGIFQRLPPRAPAAKNLLSLPEVEGLVERDLAHWLARHAPKSAESTVLAPPSVSAALYFYGGLRGLASLAWENKDGLSVALRIVISTSREEAQALIQKRGVTYLVIPSWDPFFEDYARPASVQAGEMFYTSLHRWVLPPWLKPVPFQLPKIAGFEGQSLVILEVVDEQDEPAALSRLAEYFVEMGQIDQAQSTAQGLRRFPADLGALVARAQVAIAARDANAFLPVFETIVKRVSSGADRFLPWDRRVSLAVVLARGQRMDLARKQIERCIATVDEPRLRSLTTFGLFHLETLRKTFALELPQPELRELVQVLSTVE